MTVSRTSEPFDERALQALFEDVEPPADLEANWRNRVGVTAPAKGRRAGRRFQLGAWFWRATSPWMRVLAAGIAATAAAGVMGVVAAKPQPSPEPDSDLAPIKTITNTPPTQLSLPRDVPPVAPLGPRTPAHGQLID
jgi:hypothetical protein